MERYTIGSLIFLIFATSTFYVEIDSKNLFVVIPMTQKCTILDHTIVHNITCKSKNINRTLNLGSREIFFQPGVTLTNLHVNLVLYRKFATVYRQFMVDIHYDLCALYAGNLTSITKYIDIERRRKYGNYSDPCPITGNRYEYNVPFDFSNPPHNILPAGEYHVDVIHYTWLNGTKKDFLLTQNFGELKTTTAEHWRK